jgi:hypothetical protein
MRHTSMYQYELVYACVVCMKVCIRGRTDGMHEGMQGYAWLCLMHTSCTKYSTYTYSDSYQWQVILPMHTMMHSLYLTIHFNAYNSTKQAFRADCLYNSTQGTPL